MPIDIINNKKPALYKLMKSCINVCMIMINNNLLPLCDLTK